MGRTQEERRAETRGRLLSAAADLFARQGFHATSAEAVASAADRTTGALYDHFGGKDGLLVGLVELWVEQTVVDLTASLEGVADLDGRLAALWGGVVQRDSESGDAWLLLEFELWLHAVRDPEMGAVAAERFRAMRAGLAGGLVEWAAEFGFDLPAPAPELATQLIGLLLGAAFQFRLDPAAVPQPVVVAGLRRLLALDPSSIDADRRHVPSHRALAHHHPRRPTHHADRSGPEARHRVPDLRLHPLPRCGRRGVQGRRVRRARRGGLHPRAARGGAGLDRRAHRRQALRRRHRHPRQVRGHGRHRRRQARGRAQGPHPRPPPRVRAEAAGRPRRARDPRGGAHAGADRLRHRHRRAPGRDRAEPREGQAPGQRAGHPAARRDREGPRLRQAHRRAVRLGRPGCPPQGGRGRHRHRPGDRGRWPHRRDRLHGPVARGARRAGRHPDAGRGRRGRGRQMAAALAMGAQGVWTGSLWLTVAEADVPPAQMQSYLDATSRDTLRSRSWTGKPCRMLRNEWTEAWEADGNPKPLGMPMQFMLTSNAVQRGHMYPEQAKDVQFNPVGQIVGRMNKMRPAKDVIFDMVEECIESNERLERLMGQSVEA